MTLEAIDGGASDDATFGRNPDSSILHAFRALRNSASETLPLRIQVWNSCKSWRAWND